MRRLATLLLVLILAGSLHAQENTWVGKTIITIRHDVKIAKPGDANYRALLNDSVDYRVLAEKDGRIEVVTTLGVKGWFDKADAVPLEQAVAHFSDVLLREPRNANAYQKRAHAWELRGEPELAMRDINALIVLRPSDPYCWISRGVVWSTMRKHDKAIVDFSLAIRYNPNIAAAYHNRGEAFIGTKQYTKAINDLNFAVSLQPKQAPSYSSRGLARFLNEEYVKAIEDFDLAQKLDPNNAWLYKNRAWMLATCKEAKFRDGLKAVGLALKALEMESNPTSDFHETLAAAFAEAGSYREAVRRQTEALTDPLLANDDAAKGRLELYRQKKAYRQK